MVGRADEKCRVVTDGEKATWNIGENHVTECKNKKKGKAKEKRNNKNKEKKKEKTK
jgi:hypothetical protein